MTTKQKQYRQRRDCLVNQFYQMKSLRLKAKYLMKDMHRKTIRVRLSQRTETMKEP